MATALTIIFTAAGLYLFFTPYFLLGVISMLAAGYSWTKWTPKDEERFIGFLAFFAFLGVVAVVLEQIISRFFLS